MPQDVFYILNSGSKKSRPLYTMRDGTLEFLRTIPTEEAVDFATLPLHRFPYHTKYVWMPGISNSLWKGSRWDKNPEIRSARNFDKVVEFSPGKMILHNERLTLSPRAKFVVCERFFGYATQLFLDDEPTRKRIAWEWNHGAIEQDFSNTPDLWFDGPEDLEWALEAAAQIAAATGCRAELRTDKTSRTIELDKLRELTRTLYCEADERRGG